MVYNFIIFSLKLQTMLFAEAKTVVLPFKLILAVISFSKILKNYFSFFIKSTTTDRFITEREKIPVAMSLL